jgi:hypothetical protein
MSIRLAHIENGEVTNVSLAPDDYVLPDDGSQMLEADALAAGLQRRQLPGQAREQARQALRDQWSSLPAWVRGPYHAAFVSVADLLDREDDDAAEALIRFAPPMPGFSLDQLDEFDQLRDELATAIANLPSLS